MSAWIFALVLVSAALHATWNLLVKRATDKMLMTVTVTGSAGLVALACIPFFPVPSAASLPFVLASGCASILYFLMVAATYKVADMSLAYPVMRGTAPLIVALASAPLFGEFLPPMAWLAICIISAGILSMTFIRREQGGNGLALALINAAIIALCTIIDAEGARRSQSPAAYTLWIFAVTGLALVAWAAVVRRRQFPAFLRHNWHLGLPAGVGAMCSYGAALWAMTMAPVAMVAALRETAVLFGAALSWLVLKERIGPRRLAAILTIAVGAILLRLS